VRTRILTSLFAALGAVLMLFLIVPLVAMAASETPTSLWGALMEEDVQSALLVSVGGAGLATAIALLFGVPLGYLMARRTFPGKSVAQGLIDMPVVVPHTVAGIALLTVLTPSGIFGGPAAELGVKFVDALSGTVAAMLFVSAPFVVNAARNGFEAVDIRVEKVSRSLGASAWRTFFCISLPLTGRSIVSGAVMSWARGVSEFGAVLVIAYYPRVGPTLIYERFTSFGLESSRPVAVLLVAVCLLLFVVLRTTVGRRSSATGAQRYA